MIRRVALWTIGVLILAALVGAAGFYMLLLTVGPIAFTFANRAARYDWSAYRDPSHPGRLPLADSPHSWAMVGVLVFPLAVVAFFLDRQHAPRRTPSA